MTSNEEYCKVNRIPPDAIPTVLQVLAAYGDNKWWLSEDLKKLAFYQINVEKAHCVIPFDKFLDGLALLLDAPVTHIEVAFAWNELRDSVNKYWSESDFD